ncbi:hypothetical protein LINPERPRIM_LOCUS25670 [Linum perenne]
MPMSQYWGRNWQSNTILIEQRVVQGHRKQHAYVDLAEHRSS